MTAPVRSVVIGTAGHIDHGKTRLVQALTGVDTDRLPEEKRRGITIDLGFASCELPAPDGSLLQLSFVDVPGHRLFIRNMLAGVGGIDCVLLVVAADDGIMPQTEEHLAICSLLGIERGLVVLTKADLVSGERIDELRERFAAWLNKTFLKGSPVMAVSAATGEGIPELRAALAKLAADTPLRSFSGLPRLPVDRAFTVKGFGTVVTGTLQAGTLSRGETLQVEPGGISAKCRGIQVHDCAVDRVVAGSRVALNLAGVALEDVRRGVTLGLPGTMTAVDTIDVEIMLLPDAPALKHQARMHFHCFTADMMAAVSLYSQEKVSGEGCRLARLKLAAPMALAQGDRFVLRQPSPARTIGGGRVLDAHPVAAARKAHTFAWLQKLQKATALERVLLRVARRGTSGIEIGELAAELGWTGDSLRSSLSSCLAPAGELLLIAESLLLTTENFAAASQLVYGRWMQLARDTPAPAAGVKRLELYGQSRLDVRVCDAVLAELVQQKKLSIHGERGAELVLPYGAHAGHSEDDRARLATITSIYRTAGLQAPLFAEVMRRVGLPEAELRRLAVLLLRDKGLIRVGAEDLLMHPDALMQLEASIRVLRGQALDVGRFKEITGLSRKYAIPLLEYLDRQHITRKQGADRIVL